MSEAIPIGVDVGGTFTDIVAPSAAGELVALKTPSDPRDPAGAVLRGLGQLAELLGLSQEEMLRRALRKLAQLQRRIRRTYFP